VRPAEALTQAIAERVTALVVQALDVNGLLAKVDPDELLDRVDVDALLKRIDVAGLLDRVDVDLLMSRVDIDALVQRVDVDRLVAKTDIGSVIARSSGSVASGAADALRSQAVALDEFIARWATRLRRRRYPGPPGPPELLREPVLS
jgi:predicted thioredoxin/glutaredoxin